MCIVRHTDITEYFKTLGIGVGPKLPGWSTPDLHGYTNICLTEKPFGYPSHQNTYLYWKDRPKSWGVEYSEERVRGDINKVRSNQAEDTILLGSQPSSVTGSSVNAEYYHNADGYCQRNPDHYPCPNHWKGGPHLRTHISGDMSNPVPGLLAGQFGHVLDKDINDNYHIRIINSGKEDQGLCGNDFEGTEIW
jgi:hypothetical protein